MFNRINVLVGLIILVSAPSLCVAQEYENLEYVKSGDGKTYQISKPSTWSSEKSDRFLQIIRSADDTAHCTIKRTEDWSFSIISTDEYIEEQLSNRSRIEVGLSLQFENDSGRLILFDKFPIAQKLGIIIVSKGRRNEQDVVSAVYQSTNDGAVYTIGCFTLSESFGYFHPIFATIGGSLSFNKVTK